MTRFSNRLLCYRKEVVCRGHCWFVSVSADWCDLISSHFIWPHWYIVRVLCKVFSKKSSPRFVLNAEIIKETINFFHLAGFANQSVVSLAGKHTNTSNLNYLYNVFKTVEHTVPDIIYLPLLAFSKEVILTPVKLILWIDCIVWHYCLIILTRCWSCFNSSLFPSGCLLPLSCSAPVFAPFLEINSLQMHNSRKANSTVWWGWTQGSTDRHLKLFLRREESDEKGQRALGNV